MNTPNKELLTKWRLDNNIDQEEIAEKTGYTLDHIKRVERGSKNFSLNVAKKISELYGVPVETFLGDGVAVEATSKVEETPKETTPKAEKTDKKPAVDLKKTVEKPLVNTLEKEENKQLKEENDKLHKESDKLKEENNTLQEENDKLKKEIQVLTSQLDTKDFLLKERNNEVDKILEQWASSREEIKKLELDVGDLRDEVSVLSEQKRLAEQRSDKNVKTNAQLRKENKTFAGRVLALQEELQDYQNGQTPTVRLEREIEQLKVELASKTYAFELYSNSMKKWVN